MWLGRRAGSRRQDSAYTPRSSTSFTPRSNTSEPSETTPISPFTNLVGAPTLVGPAASKPPSRDSVICSLFTLVLLYGTGGLVFSWVERGNELEHYRKNRSLYESMREMYEFKKCEDDYFRDIDFCVKQREFTLQLQHFFERGGNEMEDQRKWTFFGSVFYVGTLVTTVGYGSLHPTTPLGQLLTVILGIVGIPLMAYVLSQVGSVAVHVWMPMFPVIDSQRWRIAVLGLLTVIFIILGGFIFRWLEGWPYIACFYFAATTLMTNGFGDFVPTHTLSRIITLFYILLGLGVMASLIALLQQTLKTGEAHFAKRLTTWYETVSGANSRADVCEMPPPEVRQEPTPPAEQA